MAFLFFFPGYIKSPILRSNAEPDMCNTVIKMHTELYVDSSGTTALPASSPDPEFLFPSFQIISGNLRQLNFSQTMACVFLHQIKKRNLWHSLYFPDKCWNVSGPKCCFLLDIDLLKHIKLQYFQLSTPPVTELKY